MDGSDLLSVAAAVGAGTMGGVFFAFSVFVMAALDRLRPEQAVSAMRAINVTVITPLFMLGFVGTALLCVAVVVVVATGGFVGSAGLGVAGAGVYLVGTFGLTGVYNVPRNNRLVGRTATATRGSSTGRPIGVNGRAPTTFEPPAAWSRRCC
jgi:uncharacterized membrane protein